MDKNVYIVHCVDTEGPLYESLEATFERVEDIFSVKLEATNKNLEKIRRKEIFLEGKEDALSELVDKHKIETFGDWTQLDKMLDKVMTKEFRESLLDSNGRGWIFNWFCMDHVGFKGNNPRRRDAGYHNIYDHYLSKLKSSESNRDDKIFFHYHPLPFSGNYNDCGTAYVGSNNFFEILSRKIIDRGFFPSAYRPGFHTERPDSHWLLEQWIPFDYANQATKESYAQQLDLADGRFGDWRKAPKIWFPYHPSYDDYQTEGACHRWITRCLNLDARIRSLRQEDVLDAFEQANRTGSAILAFTNHDFRDMTSELMGVRHMIKYAADKFADVRFHFTNAVDAMRKSLQLEKTSIGLSIDTSSIMEYNRAKIYIEVENRIFGSQPYLALKTVNGQYYWDNLDYDNINPRKWSYTFDSNTLRPHMIEALGVAANGFDGTTEVKVYNFLNKELKLYSYEY